MTLSSLGTTTRRGLFAASLAMMLAAIGGRDASAQTYGLATMRRARSPTPRRPPSPKC